MAYKTYQQLLEDLETASSEYRRRGPNFTGSQNARLDKLELLTKTIAEEIRPRQGEIPNGIVPFSLSLEQLAESMGIQLATLKTYLSGITIKTGVRYRIGRTIFGTKREFVLKSNSHAR